MTVGTLLERRTLKNPAPAPLGASSPQVTAVPPTGDGVVSTLFLSCSSGASGSTVVQFTYGGVVYTSQPILYGAAAAQAAASLNAAVGAGGQLLSGASFTAAGGPFKPSGSGGAQIQIAPLIGPLAAISKTDATLSSSLTQSFGGNPSSSRRVATTGFVINEKLCLDVRDFFIPGVDASGDYGPALTRAYNFANPGNSQKTLQANGGEIVFPSFGGTLQYNLNGGLGGSAGTNSLLMQPLHGTYVTIRGDRNAGTRLNLQGNWWGLLSVGSNQGLNSYAPTQYLAVEDLLLNCQAVNSHNYAAILFAAGRMVWLKHVRIRRVNVMNNGLLISARSCVSISSNYRYYDPGAYNPLLESVPGQFDPNAYNVGAGGTVPSFEVDRIFVEDCDWGLGGSGGGLTGMLVAAFYGTIYLTFRVLAGSAGTSTVLTFNYNNTVFTTPAINYGDSSATLLAKLNAATGPLGEVLPANAFAAARGTFQAGETVLVQPSVTVSTVNGATILNAATVGHADAGLTLLPGYIDPGSAGRGYPKSARGFYGVPYLTTTQIGKVGAKNVSWDSGGGAELPGSGMQINASEGIATDEWIFEYVHTKRTGDVGREIDAPLKYVDADGTDRDAYNTAFFLASAHGGGPVTNLSPLGAERDEVSASASYVDCTAYRTTNLGFDPSGFAADGEANAKLPDLSYENARVIDYSAPRGGTFPGFQVAGRPGKRLKIRGTYINRDWALAGGVNFQQRHSRFNLMGARTVLDIDIHHELRNASIDSQGQAGATYEQRGVEFYQETATTGLVRITAAAVIRAIDSVSNLVPNTKFRAAMRHANAGIAQTDAFANNSPPTDYLFDAGNEAFLRVDTAALRVNGGSDAGVTPASLEYRMLWLAQNWNVKSFGPGTIGPQQDGQFAVVFALGSAIAGAKYGVVLKWLDGQVPGASANQWLEGWADGTNQTLHAEAMLATLSAGNVPTGHARTALAAPAALTTPLAAGATVLVRGTIRGNTVTFDVFPGQTTMPAITAVGDTRIGPLTLPTSIAQALGDQHLGYGGLSWIPAAIDATVLKVIWMPFDVSGVVWQNPVVLGPLQGWKTASGIYVTSPADVNSVRYHGGIWTIRDGDWQGMAPSGAAPLTEIDTPSNLPVQSINGRYAVPPASGSAASGALASGSSWTWANPLKVPVLVSLSIAGTSSVITAMSRTTREGATRVLEIGQEVALRVGDSVTVTGEASAGTVTFTATYDPQL